MRTIERSSVFKRDYKRAKAAPRHRKDLDPLLSKVVEMLLFDRPLPVSVKPDLLLIYRKPDPRTLRLARVGSHSELFG
jgi:mRNA interferase YafQ